jgi:hypothetical protein
MFNLKLPAVPVLDDEIDACPLDFPTPIDAGKNVREEGSMWVTNELGPDNDKLTVKFLDGCELTVTITAFAALLSCDICSDDRLTVTVRQQAVEMLNLVATAAANNMLDPETLCVEKYTSYTVAGSNPVILRVDTIPAVVLVIWRCWVVIWLTELRTAPETNIPAKTDPELDSFNLRVTKLGPLVLLTTVTFGGGTGFRKFTSNRDAVPYWCPQLDDVNPHGLKDTPDEEQVGWHGSEQPIHIADFPFEHSRAL